VLLVHYYNIKRTAMADLCCQKHDTSRCVVISSVEIFPIFLTKRSQLTVLWLKIMVICFFDINQIFQSNHGVFGGGQVFLRHSIHRVSKKTSTHIIGHKLRNSCPIFIIFDIKIPHII